MEKVILDACCGSKMMWFQKNRADTIYADKRTEYHILCDGRTLEVSPDIEIDFTKMPFDDEQFYLVVFDPPHLNKLGKKSWMAKKYGVLGESWETDLKKGFDECWRVLKTNGTLIFKWNENQIPVNKIIEIVGVNPLFGHPTRHSKTIWMTFFKSPTPSQPASR
jgi:hypothetical protein